MSFTEDVDNFLKCLSNLGYSHNTVKGYRRDLKALGYFMGQARLLRTIELTAPLLERFLSQSKYSEKSVSPANRNRRLSCLRSFFRYLVLQGDITDKDNPTRTIRFSRLPRSEPSYLSYSEYVRLIQTVRKTGEGWRARRDVTIIALLYNTGMRLSELISLDTDQVDIANARIIGLRRKGGYIKDLPVNQTVLWALSAWFEEHPFKDELSPYPLFISRLKRRISPRTVEQMISDCAKRAGLTKRVSPHTFRHSVCSELQRRGASIRATQELLDHASVQTTMRYSHSVESELRLALASLEDQSLWLNEIRLFTKRA